MHTICHMVISLDGRTTGDFLTTPQGLAAADHYYEINRTDPAQAYACGRTTMEGSFTGGHQPDWAAFESAGVPAGDFVATLAPRYAVCFDRLGRLGWQTGTVDDADPGYGGAHVVEVLSPAAPAAARAYYRSIGVSYIVADSLPQALEKLQSHFGITRMLLEGGSEINGAFLRAGLIDELSLVVAPITARPEDKPLFATSDMSSFRLISTTPHPSGSLLLRYARA